MVKKTTKTTKKSTPRATKKVEITEKQYSEAVVKDIEKVSNEEVTTIIDNLKDDEIELNQEYLEEVKKVSGVKEDFKEEVNQDPPLEVMNGDTTVVTTIDKIEEEAMAETFKENKKKRLIDNMIGYSWNGQEIDYIL